MNELRGPRADVADGLFERARSGDQDAWRELYEACYPKVLRVIRRRLNSRVRSLYDSTDFVGDVWKSLAEKPDQFDFPNVEALTAFLAIAAQRKVIDAHRRLHAAKNDIERHRPLAAWSDLGDGAPALQSPEPTPSQVAQATETAEFLLSGLGDEDREVLALKRQDYGNQEVAERVGWSLRKVQRFLKDLNDSWIARRGGERP